MHIHGLAKGVKQQSIIQGVSCLEVRRLRRIQLMRSAKSKRSTELPGTGLCICGAGGAVISCHSSCMRNICDR